MRCLEHKAEAVAVCAYCGRALCLDCVQSSNTPRMVCSSACAEALSRNEQAIQTILQQGALSAKASAFYCYLCGGLSAAAGVVAWFMLPSPFLMLFTGGSALVLTASGLWYGRIARRQPLSELTPTRRVSVKHADSSKVEPATAGGRSPKANVPVETRP